MITLQTRWQVEAARPDMARYERIDRPRPEWARRFLRRKGGDDLLAAIDHSVAELLVSSNAIDCDRAPHVWLLRVCAQLGAKVRWLPEARDGAIQPVAFPRGAGRLRRGRIHLNAKGEWNVLVGSRRDEVSRFDLAHELGHAILYRDGSRVDVEAWHRAPWSEAEEACCNYAARSLLAPPTLMTCPGPQDNLAAFIVREVAGRFRMPLRAGVYRWLDVDPLTQSTAVILWRQYHPLDRYFLISQFRERPALMKAIGGFAGEINSLVPDCTFSEGLEICRYLTSPNEELRCPAIAARNVLFEMRRAMASWDTADRDLASLVFGERLPYVLARPEWVVWLPQPLRCFIPLKKGSFRSGSMVEQLMRSSGAGEARGEESVSIGQLRGVFDVHGFAWGSAERGHRCVLQVLRRDHQS